MKEEFKQFVKDQNVLILGFAREGKATYRLLKEVGSAKSIGIADIENVETDNPSVSLHCGENYLDCIDEYDIVFKAPGIVLPKPLSEYRAFITSEVDCFLGFYRDKIIGVTGTKGKSTTSSLLYHTLSENGVPAVLAGNIGIPVFDVLDDIKDDTIIVLELSCHQLEFCRFSPHIAILLNLFEEHLDHYGTLENYFNAKRNIYKYQRKDDILYFGENVFFEEDNSYSKKIKITPDILPITDLSDIEDGKLCGEGNLKNCAFVYAVTKSLGLSDKQIIESIKTFKPLSHRLQFVGEINGVKYYDDSISTTSESAINAVKSLQNVGTILLGGMDRDIHYDSLVKFLTSSEVKNAICMYESGKRIFDMFEEIPDKNISVFYCETLEDAVKLAKKITPSHTSCVLSPASASYGPFKNFEERGDFFRKHIEEP